MTILFKRGDSLASIAAMFPDRVRSNAAGVSPDIALRNSAVWASLRLRADLISSLPVDVYRKVAGIQVDVPTPPVLVSPDGKISIREWLYSSQMDLDRVGNCYGLITARDGSGNPARIELQPATSVTVRQSKDGVVSYLIGGVKYDAKDVWHERQHTIPGLAVGLSPVSYAAWSLGFWQSAIQFAQDWYANSGHVPSGHLKNVAKTLTDTDADRVKARYKATVQSGDIFVTGNDWEFSTEGVTQADANFLEAQQYTDRDAVRFFGIPADLADVVIKGSQVTYANITQRNLQFLVMHLGPAIGRREDALSRLLPAPRFVKLNTGALLRMDPAQVSTTLISEVAGRITTPTEARALLNRPPLSAQDIAEFKDLGFIGNSAAQPAVAPAAAEPISSGSENANGS